MTPDYGFAVTGPGRYVLVSDAPSAKAVHPVLAMHVLDGTSLGGTRCLPGRAGTGGGRAARPAAQPWRRQSGHRPNSSTVCPTSVKPAFLATSSAHRSTALPSTSTLRPQNRQVRW